MFEEARILIVDDDAEDLASLKRALESLGAAIHTVRDPHEVLEATRRENPGVVILDALLPGLSGFDLCKQIKSDSALKGIQVVVITGVYLRKQYRQEALQQFKADAFMTKPFRPPELQRLVAQLLAKWTKKPQKSFLRRLGRPGASLGRPGASSEAEKRGFWGRLFGRTEAEEAPTRIAPVRPARRAAKTVSAPKPSRVAAVKTPVVTKLAEPESKPDAVVESAATIAVSPDASTKKSEEHAIATEPPSSSAGSEPIATGDEASTPQASEEPSGETASSATIEDVSSASEEPPDAADASAPAAEPVAEAASGEVEETASVDDESSAEPEPAVPDEASAANAPPVPEAAEEDQSAAKDEKGVQPRAADAAPAESSATPAESSATEDAPATATETRAFAPPAEEEKEVQSDAPASVATIETQAGTTEPASELPPLRKPIFRVGDVPIYGEQDFHSELKRELSKCRRVDRPLTIILVQVDDLTQIVELFGKEIREAVLRHVAELATWCLREIDLVGMMTSKDLVALIAFASDEYGGSRVVNRMRKTVQKNPFRVGEELPPIMPALRFGMSSYPDDGEDVVGLIAEAYEDIE